MREPDVIVMGAGLADLGQGRLARLQRPRRHLRGTLAISAAALLTLSSPAAGAGTGSERAKFDTRVFARVSAPGHHPEPVAIGPDGLAYVATNQGQLPNPATDGEPSRIDVYDRVGRLVRRETLKGQDLTKAHGIQGLAFDGSGLLYVLDRADVNPRVVVIDPTTGRQRD